MYLLGCLVLMTTEVLLSQWRRIKKLKIIPGSTRYPIQIPICMGNGFQCLNITFQGWLSIVNTTQDYHNQFYIFHASGFEGQEINVTSSIHLPFCEMKVTNKESDWVHGQQRKSEKP